MRSWTMVLGVTFLLVAAAESHALNRDITAVFRPDSAKPSDNKFINTTPTSGYCASYPAQCGQAGMFSIRLPIRFASNGPIQPNHEDPQQGATFKVPAEWREISVTNADSGESEIVEVRVRAIGSQYALPDSAVNLVGGGVGTGVAHGMLWGSSWVNSPAPCRYSGVGAYSSSQYAFLWQTPVEASCSKRARYLIPQLAYNYLDFAYELRTPNPLKMSVGHYTGSLTYRIGPGQDFDMGTVMVANEAQLTLDFNLEVQHTLKIEVPPGGNRVQLEPQGGWQAWLTQGRKPTRLFRDQTFHIYTSSRFKMLLECQYGVGANTCALWEPNVGHAVPVNISVSLPHGLTDAEGQRVNRRLLRRDGSGTELFQPGFYVERKPATLHFEIARDYVEEMLSGSSRTYAGNVTVIWDSEV